jgi:hypothetical protein
VEKEFRSYIEKTKNELKTLLEKEKEDVRELESRIVVKRPKSPAPII